VGRCGSSTRTSHEEIIFVGRGLDLNKLGLCVLDIVVFSCTFFIIRVDISYLAMYFADASK